MSDAFDKRRKGLEEEYFHRKNKEAIEKLREKMKVGRGSQSGRHIFNALSAMRRSLKESKFEDVSIDTCEKCGGVWLDSGELEQLTKHEKGGWLSGLFGGGD